MDLVPQLALIRRRVVPENIGARDVGLIAVHRAGAVHQDDLAPLDDLRLVAAVRIGRRLSEQDETAVIAPAERLLRSCDKGVDLLRRHALAGVRRRVTKGSEYDVVRRLHQRQFVRRLDHPATANHRIAAHHLDGRQLLLQPIENEIAVCLLEADRLRCDSALAEEIGDELQRLLILVPCANFRRDRQRFGDRRLLEKRSDDDRLANCWNDGRRQALGPPPLHTGEIVEARARFDDDRADSALGH
jgi:hypothetical protein